MKHSERIRILQVVGGMNRGGAETWLMHILRHLDPAEFQMDFLVHEGGPFAFDQEILALGSRTVVCAGTGNPWRYARNFRRIVREEGPYDIVHSHVQYYNGFVMWLAKMAGIRTRIAHSHLDTSPERASAGFLRRMYFRVMERSIERHATLGIAVSKLAATALFGPDWAQRENRRLLYCGIDLAAFPTDGAAPQVRASLGIPAAAFVIGHVGRMMEQKNHKFLIEIFAEIARRESKAHLLLVGDGPLRADVERQVDSAGLRSRVTFAGVRSDVPRLMRGTMSLLLLPSLFEGLPLVGMEAQAGGLPLLISDVIAPELDLIPDLVHRLPLSASAVIWADKLQALIHSPPPLSPLDAVAQIARGPFNIQTGIKELTSLYREQMAGTNQDDGSKARFQPRGMWQSPYRK